MKKSKKLILRVLPIVMVCLVMFSFSFVFAASSITEPINAGSALPNGTASNKVTSVTGNIWSTVIVVIQVLAVAAVVFAGLRYMFASADQKADIKKSLIHLVIGCVIVFGAVTVISLITKVFGQIV